MAGVGNRRSLEQVDGEESKYPDGDVPAGVVSRYGGQDGWMNGEKERGGERDRERQKNPDRQTDTHT